MTYNMEYCRNDNIRDHLIYVIICTEDNTILTQKIADGVKCEHFMISTTLEEDEGWNAAGRKLASQVGYSKSFFSILQHNQ